MQINTGVATFPLCPTSGGGVAASAGSVVGHNASEQISNPLTVDDFFKVFRTQVLREASKLKYDGLCAPKSGVELPEYITQIFRRGLWNF